MADETTAAAPAAAAPASTEAPAAALAAEPAAPAAPAVNDAAAALGAPAAEAAKPAEAPAAPNPDALTMPGKDATPEQWSEFYGKIGRPESPDKYDLPLPEGNDGAFAKAVAPMLHKAGLTSEQAKVLATEWTAMQTKAEADYLAGENARIEAQNSKNKAEADALKTEWGDQNDANMEHARRAMRQFFPAEKAGDVIAAIEGVVGYKGTITMLHDMGKGMGEHGAPGLGDNTSGGGTPKTLAERMYPNMTNT